MQLKSSVRGRLPKNAKSYLFLTGNVPQLILDSYPRGAAYHCSSERENDHVIGEKCLMFSFAFLQLCHIPSGLATSTLRNEQESWPKQQSLSLAVDGCRCEHRAGHQP